MSGAQSNQTRIHSLTGRISSLIDVEYSKIEHIDLYLNHYKIQYGMTKKDVDLFITLNNEEKVYLYLAMFSKKQIIEIIDTLLLRARKQGAFIENDSGKVLYQREENRLYQHKN